MRSRSQLERFSMARNRLLEVFVPTGLLKSPLQRVSEAVKGGPSGWM
jgi:hypothetical protein